MVWIFVILLGICAYYDLREQRIPAVWIWTCIGIQFMYRTYMIFEGRSKISECVICILPGLIILIFSYMSRHVGNGDGWLIIASGLCLQLKELLVALFCAFMAVGVFSTCCLIFTKKGKETRIPFVPFLFLGIVFLVGRRLYENS